MISQYFMELLPLSSPDEFPTPHNGFAIVSTTSFSSALTAVCVATVASLHAFAQQLSFCFGQTEMLCSAHDLLYV
jgi:hypothetical protein